VQRIYDQLRNDITFGKFKPGEHLSERFLTQKYKVSRATMREIIGQLATQGYLTFEQNKGVIVTKLSLQDIDVTYNILSRCESYATALFTEKKDGDVIKELGLLHEKMLGKRVKLDYKAWLQLNDEFHGLISLGCGNVYLKELIYHTRLRIYRFRRVETNIEIINFYNKQHRKVLMAIREGDFKSAERQMALHLETARKHRFEVFKEFGEII